MANKVLILNEYAYSASITDTPIPYRQIKHASIGLQALQNGTTACTLSEFLQELSEVQFSAKGNIMDGVSIDGEDLLALNLMWLGNVPEFRAGSTTDNACIFISPLYVPLGIRVDTTPSFHLYHTDNPKSDNHKVTLGLDLGVGQRYLYFKKNDTADTTGTDVDMSKKGLKLAALMCYAQSVPSTTDFNRGIKELKIYVDKVEQYHYNWFELGKGLSPVNAVECVNLGAIADNYRILIFSQPIPADDLTVWTKSDTAENTIEFIGIYV